MSLDNTNETHAVEEESLPMFAFDQWIHDIVEQTKEDSTTPFLPDNLFNLVRLKYTNLALFEGLRTELNGLGIAFARFDAAVKQQEKSMPKDGEAEKRSIADAIIGALDGGEYFHATDGTAYADIVTEKGHRETWPIYSAGFEQWVRRQCYTKLKGIPGNDSLNAAINTLAAKAIIDGVEQSVYMRTASHEEKIYIDLCDESWRAIEVDASGYRVIDVPPVRFRRRKGMRPLPLPQVGGKIEELRSFLNLKNDNGFVLLVSWLLMALRGHGPYPILVVVGEQGTAKSTLMALLRQLVDPHSAPLRTLPRDVRDLFIAANNSLVLAFDNLSYMSDWISDALCRLSTGGGFATRALNTDDDEILFDAMRPILMNGIENVGTRGDLVDRAVILLLEPIPEEKRKPAKQLQAEFDEAYPRIFGALLEMMVHGLQTLPDVKLDRQPRMADFAIWATACETADSGKQGVFMKAYESNRAEANEDVIAASALATAVCGMLHQARSEWKGTATELLKELANYVDGEQVVWDKRLWPQTAKMLSERLSRVAPALRRVGVEIKRENGKNHQRLITLHRTSEGLNSAPPAPGAPASRGVANREGSAQTVVNDGEQKKPAKFASKAKKK